MLDQFPSGRDIFSGEISVSENKKHTLYIKLTPCINTCYRTESEREKEDLIPKLRHRNRETIQHNLMQDLLWPRGLEHT